MRQHWMQAAVLCVCIVLLGMTIHLNKQLHETRTRLEQQLNTVETLVENMGNEVALGVKEARRLVADSAFAPQGVDLERHTLRARLDVSLREWRADTAVTALLTVDGQDEQALPLQADAAGRYTGVAEIPLDHNGELIWDVQVMSGGLITRENVGGWSELSMLLPLQYSGGGWGHPDYVQGRLQGPMHLNVVIQGFEDTLPAQPTQPEFLIYRNGKQVESFPASIQHGGAVGTSWSYAVDADAAWDLACAPDDRVQVTFRCRDSSGLGYEFNVLELRVTEDGVADAFSDDTDSLILSWPE